MATHCLLPATISLFFTPPKKWVSPPFQYKNRVTLKLIFHYKYIKIKYLMISSDFLQSAHQHTTLTYIWENYATHLQETCGSRVRWLRCPQYISINTWQL